MAKANDKKASEDIGDINATEPGTAARFNGGKPDLSLIPLHIIAQEILKPEDPDLEDVTDDEVSVLYALSAFQMAHIVGASDQEFNLDCLSFILFKCGYDWEGCAAVFEYGKHTYKEWNWLRGMPWSAVIASAARHALAMKRGEELDPESGLPHKAHLMCNVVMLYQYIFTYQEGDDRPQI